MADTNVYMHRKGIKMKFQFRDPIHIAAINASDYLGGISYVKSSGIPKDFWVRDVAKKFTDSFD